MMQDQKNTKSNDASPAFTARLRYGRLLEPWVERVEFGLSFRIGHDGAAASDS
jgi:hypothetical protein